MYLTKKGLFTFGVSRDAYKKVYLPKAKVADPSIPGPGAYDNKFLTIGTEGKKWGIRQKIKNI
jgi:hypothetical protein